MSKTKTNKSDLMFSLYCSSIKIQELEMTKNIFPTIFGFVLIPILVYTATTPNPIYSSWNVKLKVLF
jgi:hypothetical protein